MAAKIHTGPTARLDKGAAILAAANEHSTDVIKARLGAFAAAQRRFADAQRKVDEADAQLGAAHAVAAARDADQDAALTTLAGALITDGQPWGTPFAVFGCATLASLKRLPCAEKAAAIHQLITEIKRQSTTSASVSQCANVGEQAAQAAEAALASLDPLQQTARAMRHRRDAVIHNWEITLAALKRGSRAAADDGAPGLYTALFGNLKRPSRKKPSTAPPPTPPAAATAPTG